MSDSRMVGQRDSVFERDDVESLLSGYRLRAAMTRPDKAGHKCLTYADGIGISCVLSGLVADKG